MNTLYSFFLTTLAGLSTLIGMIIIFISKRKSNKVIISSLSFASGVMICVSIIDLLPESINLFIKKMSLIPSVLFFCIFFCIGVLISMFIDKKMPDNNSNGNLYKVGIISMLAIILHNIPEGIATFMASNMNEKLGLSLALAIAMHNIPEGISISVPIYYSTKSKMKAFLYTFISALSEPFGALLAFIFLKSFITDFFMGMLFAFIAGIMMHISLYELLREAKSYNNNKLTSIFFMIGIMFMLLNHFII